MSEECCVVCERRQLSDEPIVLTFPKLTPCRTVAEADPQVGVVLILVAGEYVVPSLMEEIGALVGELDATTKISEVGGVVGDKLREAWRQVVSGTTPWEETEYGLTCPTCLLVQPEGEQVYGAVGGYEAGERLPEPPQL